MTLLENLVFGKTRKNRLEKYRSTESNITFLLLDLIFSPPSNT